jgi:hypothetical protein
VAYIQKKQSYEIKRKYQVGQYTHAKWLCTTLSSSTWSAKIFSHDGTSRPFFEVDSTVDSVSVQLDCMSLVPWICQSHHLFQPGDHTCYDWHLGLSAARRDLPERSTPDDVGPL